ncbi:hypothetical protein DMENIID0001_015600 [Sergentomyia squamirostris]
MEGQKKRHVISGLVDSRAPRGREFFTGSEVCLHVSQKEKVCHECDVCIRHCYNHHQHHQASSGKCGWWRTCDCGR